MRMRRLALAAGLIGAGTAIGLGLGLAFDRPIPKAPAVIARNEPGPVPAEGPEPWIPAAEPPAEVHAEPPGGTGVSEEPGLPRPAPPPAALVPAALVPAVAPPPVAVLLPLPPPPPPPSAAGPSTWQRHAVGFVPPPGKALVVMVFDDLGMDRPRTRRVIALPGPLTLAFLPYAGELPAQTRAAHAGGHELLIHLPMEPMSASAHPGPGALLTGLPPTENQRRLTAALGAFQGYTGVNNHMGSRFTASREAMAPVLAELARRGLLFLDSRTTGTSAAGPLAAELRLAHAGRDVFLDDIPTPAAVEGQLRHLEQIARRTGQAIAIGHPHDATIEAVAGWLHGLAGRGLALAPLSAVVQPRPASPATPLNTNTTHRKGAHHG